MTARFREPRLAKLPSESRAAWRRRTKPQPAKPPSSSYMPAKVRGNARVGGIAEPQPVTTAKAIALVDRSVHDVDATVVQYERSIRAASTTKVTR